jgi:acetyl esterase/lipase
VPADISIREDVVYGRGGGRDLKCDVYAAEGAAGLRPGVLLVHGGGWQRGSKDMMKEFALRLGGAGYVCIAPEYRLTPESPWPAQIHDVKAAIRWTRANAAELGIDPTRIAAQGSSAGAHLVLLAAATPGLAEFEGDGGNAGVGAELAAVVGIYPPVAFFIGEQRTRGATPSRALMGEGASEEAARGAGPIHHVTPSHPPTMLLHGTADKTVPVSASLVMYDVLVQRGVPAEMHLYAEQPHGFARQGNFPDLCMAEVADFLNRYLVAAPAAAQEAAGS